MGGPLVSCHSGITDNSVVNALPFIQTDYVEILDIVDGKVFKRGRYCEQHKPPTTIYSMGHELIIRFHSNLVYQYNGFKIFYSHADIAGILQLPNFS